MNRDGRPLSISVALALLAATANGIPVSDFEQLVKIAKKFNGKRVTVVGLAEIGGSEFFLYPDVQSAKRGENAIFVDAHILNENSYQKFNNHWLKITGIVDTGIRPPLRVGECSIVLERLKLLPLRPLRDDSVRGVFRNSTGQTIDIRVPTPTGYAYAMRIAPSTATEAMVISHGKVTVTKKSGQTVAKGTLSWKDIADEYFDRNSRTFYYRIRDGRITPVLPREAKNWRK